MIGLIVWTSEWYTKVNEYLMVDKDQLINFNDDQLSTLAILYISAHKDKTLQELVSEHLNVPTPEGDVEKFKRRMELEDTTPISEKDFIKLLLIASKDTDILGNLLSEFKISSLISKSKKLNELFSIFKLADFREGYKIITTNRSIYRIY